MRCTAILAAAIGGFCVSSSFAGFTVTATKVVSGGFDRWDIVAVNDGVGTGSQVKGMEYFYSGSPAAFTVDDTTDTVGGDPDGIGDTVNLLSTSRTRVRVSTTAANNVFVGVSPTNGFAQPNPYDAPGASQFSGAIANTGVTQATGAGFQIARIFLPTGGQGVFSGNLGGDVGLKVPFTVNLGGTVNANPVIGAVPTVNVVFGSIVTSGAPFSANVTVTDANAADVLSLALGSLPSSLSGVTITGATGTSPRTFTVSGTVDYSANGTDVVIPLTASDGAGGTGTGSITLHVTPEPASLSLIGLSSLFLGRRRK